MRAAISGRAMKINLPGSKRSTKAAPHSLDKAARPQRATANSRAVGRSPSSTSNASQQPDITMGKPIHISQLPQRNVLRRPLANSVQGQQSRHAALAIRLKQPRIIQQCLCHARQRPPATFRHAQRRQICRCQYVRLGKHMASIRAPTESSGAPYCATSFPARRIAATTRNLLPEHRAKRQLQAIPRPGNP